MVYLNLFLLNMILYKNGSQIFYGAFPPQYVSRSYSFLSKLIKRSQSDKPGVQSFVTQVCFLCFLSMLIQNYIPSLEILSLNVLAVCKGL